MPVLALLRRRLAPIALAALALAISASTGLQAQQPEPGGCRQRPTLIYSEFYADFWRWCVDSVFHDPMIEPLSFTAMAVAPDGTLFATRPLSGAVMALRDTDGDDLPDTMETFAEGLTLPNGLAYHDGALYVAGGARIDRIFMTGAAETIVDDLPSGAGFWTGGIAIGDDSRLYVALGAPCDNCVFEARDRGLILSMNLDGSDRQIVATGFRQPADVEFFRGQVWTLDSAPIHARRGAFDELNLVQPGGWYGFPNCIGAGEGNSASADVDCANSIPPVMRFGGGAVPTSLAAYTHDTLPGVKDTLIIVLSGAPSQIDFVGYKVIMINFDEANRPLGATVLIPFRRQDLQQAYAPYRGEALYWNTFIHISELGFGFYPNQPLAVAVEPRGWIYISMTGGRIIALRPRQAQLDYEALYPIWTPMNPKFDPSEAPGD